MSKSEENTIDHSIKVVPDQSGYIAIPLPSRIEETEQKSGPSGFLILSRIRFRRRLRLPLTRAERIQKRDLEQSIAIAVVVNLLVIFSLLFIVIKTPAPSEGTFVSTKAGDESASKDNKSDRTEDSSNQVQTASKELLKGAADSTSTSTDVQAVSLSTIEIQPGMVELQPPTLSFGRSVAHYEMGGVPGVDRALLESLLPKSRYGNGSRLALFVDESRSMQKIGDAVTSYVSTSFRHSRIRSIDNCKMLEESNSFAVHFGDAALNSRCTDFVFVSDLRDPQSEIGVDVIRRFLRYDHYPRRLHIISFGKRPRKALASMIESTGGTFTLIDLP